MNNVDLNSHTFYVDRVVLLSKIAAPISVAFFFQYLMTVIGRLVTTCCFKIYMYI